LPEGQYHVETAGLRSGCAGATARRRREIGAATRGDHQLFPAGLAAARHDQRGEAPALGVAAGFLKDRGRRAPANCLAQITLNPPGRIPTLDGGQRRQRPVSYCFWRRAMALTSVEMSGRFVYFA
jgi:hypothetical protein